VKRPAPIRSRESAKRGSRGAKPNRGRATPSRKGRSEKLDLRISAVAKALLARAASAAGSTLSAFVLESALKRADETLVERRRFGLDAKQWERFLEALDAPARTPARLQQLLTEPSVFER
jgi:uncharacterized protein (DUF1778 family)